MGDAAQIPPVGSSDTPVFTQGYPEVELLQVMRQQDGSPVKAICENVRNAVVTGEPLRKFELSDGVIHLPQEAFEQAMLDEFTRSDWKYGDSIVLSYTNEAVRYYNDLLFRADKGRDSFEVGDYALNNKFVKSLKDSKNALKTEETVLINAITKKSVTIGTYIVDGKNYRIKNANYFRPNDPTIRERLLNMSSSLPTSDVETVMECFMDLRPLYACTINKSQGSTFDTVFIDLNTLSSKLRDRELLLRLLYVAVSRARSKLIFTGNLSK